MKKIVIGLLAVLAWMVVAAGHAEIRPGAASLTPFIGGYTFEGNQDLKTGLAYGIRAGYYFTQNWGLEAYLYHVPTQNDSLAGNPAVDLLGYGVEALYHFMPEGRLVPFLAAGMGGAHYDGSRGLGDRNKFTVDYGAGLKYFLTDNLALRADVRHVLPLNDRYNDLLYTVGFTFSWGGEKKPVVAETRAAAPAAAPVAIEDSDLDGVPDYLDKCPGTPKGMAVDKDGCPMAALVEPKAAVPVAATPMEKAIEEKGRVTLKVLFDFDKAVVKNQYHNEIGNLAEVMKKRQELKILIEGHTDSVGDAKYNEQLSQRRADAVRKYLVEKFGIDGSRLTAKGFGESRPVASNATKEGRQENRRVEAAAEYITIIKK